VQDIHRSRIETDSDVVGSSVAERLIHAFNALDDNLSTEALTRIPNGEGGEKNMKTLTVAMSGSVAVVAHIDGPMLHVASTGDCTAVLGSLSENDTWYGMARAEKN
jgi:pyruvate dehydrogenase phosphatase